MTTADYNMEFSLTTENDESEFENQSLECSTVIRRKTAQINAS